MAGQPRVERNVTLFHITVSFLRNCLFSLDKTRLHTYFIMGFLIIRDVGDPYCSQVYSKRICFDDYMCVLRGKQINL